MTSATTRTNQKSLLRSTSSFAATTFVSRLLGFARDMVIAHVFGANGNVDAFLVAFKLPNFMRRLFAEGAFTQAFVPVLAEVQSTESVTKTRQFMGRTAGTLGIVLLVFTVLAVFASPVLVGISAPGFLADPDRFSLCVDMLRITFPYLFFISMTAMCAAILNNAGYFAAPAFTPILLNLSMLATALVVAPAFHIPIKALAYSVIVAGILQLGFLLLWLWQAGLLFFPTIAWRDPAIRKTLQLMVPALFGVSVAQVNLYMDTLFATFLVSGSVSWLYFSLQLTNFPLGVFGVAIATVITPRLAHQSTQQETDAFQQTLIWGTKMVLLIGIPATIGLEALAKPLLATLFQYGQFDDHDVAMTTLSLRAFAIGLPAFMLVKIFTSAFYARQNIKTPVRVACIATFANLLLNLLLIVPLAHTGLALSTSLAQYLNAAILLVLLHRHRVIRFTFDWLKFSLQLVMANGLMALALFALLHHFQPWFLNQWSTRLTGLLITILISMVCYAFGLFLSGFRPQSVKKLS